MCSQLAPNAAGDVDPKLRNKRTQAAIAATTTVASKGTTRGLSVAIPLMRVLQSRTILLVD